MLADLQKLCQPPPLPSQDWWPPISTMAQAVGFWGTTQGCGRPGESYPISQCHLRHSQVAALLLSAHFL